MNKLNLHILTQRELARIITEKAREIDKHINNNPLVLDKAIDILTGLVSREINVHEYNCFVNLSQLIILLSKRINNRHCGIKTMYEAIKDKTNLCN